MIMSTKFHHPGRCAGCHRERDLHYSHVLPKMIYRRSRKAARVAPVTISGGTAVQVDKEIRQHLLCADCEFVLKTRGEDPASAVMYQPNGDCPLYKLLGFSSKTTSPFESRESRPGPGGRTVVRPAYRAGARKLDRKGLIQFALGVFWRFSVSDHRDARFEFRAYDEHVRRFIFEDAPLAPDVHLRLDVLDLPRKGATSDELLNSNLHCQTFMPRWEVVEPTWGEARWLCYGFVFRLFLGAAPRKLVRGALTGRPPYFLRFVPSWDHLERAAEMVHKSERKGRLARE